MPLLDAKPDPILLSMLVPYLISAAGLLLAFYALFRKESREDGQTIPQRLLKLEATLAVHEKRQEGFQMEIENVADQATRARDAIVENIKRDFDAVKHDIKDVPTMRDMLNRMDERFTNTSKEFDKLDRKMDQILATLTYK